MFRKHCVDVKFVSIVGGPAASAAMVSGSLNFASSTADVIMRSRSKGVDFRFISNMYAGQWSALLAKNQLALPYLRAGYPEIMKDLAGTKIGVTALGGSTEAYMRASFEGAGMNGSSATYVAVGGVTTAVPALKQGVVDGAMMFGTGPDLAEALGAGKIVIDYRIKGVGPEVMQALWGATLGWSAYGPYIDKNPDVVAAFAAANNEAIAWIQNPQNRNELYQLIGKRMPLPDSLPNRQETLKRIVDINANDLGVGIPPASIQGWNKYLLSLKQIQSPISYQDLVWKTGRS
jgi:NitT/TauT family transport system substrate-binding protein